MVSLIIIPIEFHRRDLSVDVVVVDLLIKANHVLPHPHRNHQRDYHLQRFHQGRLHPYLEGETSEIGQRGVEL